MGMGHQAMHLGLSHTPASAATACDGHMNEVLMVDLLYTTVVSSSFLAACNTHKLVLWPWDWDHEEVFARQSTQSVRYLLQPCPKPSSVHRPPLSVIAASSSA
jgi:hypothetical protein